MFDLTQHPNSNILYITAKGKITDDDYEDVLIPAMEATLREFEKIRLLIHMGEAYDGIEGEAIWNDTKVGMKHFTHFEKTAIVSDVTWIRRSIKVFGFLVPGEVKLFANADLAQAKSWVVE